MSGAAGAARPLLVTAGLLVGGLLIASCTASAGDFGRPNAAAAQPFLAGSGPGAALPLNDAERELRERAFVYLAPEAVQEGPFGTSLPGLAPGER